MERGSAQTAGGFPVEAARQIAANLRAERARCNLSQEAVAEGMRRLGFTVWQYSTVSKVERVARPVTAAEITGLAMVLETTAVHLLPASGGAGSGSPAGRSTPTRL